MAVNFRIWWLCLLMIIQSSGVESFVTPIQQMTNQHHRPSYSVDKSSYITICSNNIILSRVLKMSKRYRCSRLRDSTLQSPINENNEDTNTKSKTSTRLWQQYYSMMRPITIIQAVGAFLVGRLVILSSSSYNQNTITTTILASISIYLAYGAGMAMNDIADVNIDSQHDKKQNRSIASNNISVKQGWMFCIVLSMLSVAFACLANSMNNGHNMATTTNTGLNFVGWTILNILLMLSYALGMQRIFLIKNIICGFLAVSPLIGSASLLLPGSTKNDMHMMMIGTDITSKLYQLTIIGFPLQVSREILKDIEDIEVDYGTKQTLPLLIGKTKSKRLAYGIVAIINWILLFSPYYWKMFASRIPVYAISIVVGVPMCIKASILPLEEGQRLLKKSIYVLLFGMIMGLMMQTKK